MSSRLPFRPKESFVCELPDGRHVQWWARDWWVIDGEVWTPQIRLPRRASWTLPWLRIDSQTGEVIEVMMPRDSPDGPISRRLPTPQA